MLDEKLASVYGTRDTLRFLTKAFRDPGVIKLAQAGMEKQGQGFAPQLGPGLFQELLGRAVGPNVYGHLGFRLPMMLMGQVAAKAVRPAWRPTVHGQQLLSSGLQDLAGSSLNRARLTSMGRPF